MRRFLLPAGEGESELNEKRSRFLGHVRPVSSEREAQEWIASVRAAHRDATHNVWAWRIRESGNERCSDDGEPQGTSGAPVLDVFSRAGVTDVCCVVTRYFGGTLLGAGGLVRAYTAAAKQALASAGTKAVVVWKEVRFRCGYHHLAVLKNLVAASGGVVANAVYGEDVAVTALFPEDRAKPFLDAAPEMTAGSVVPQITGETLLPE